MRIITILFTAAIFLFVGMVPTVQAEQRAQLCFKAKDLLKDERYAAVIEIASQATGGALFGCEIKRVGAKMFCVPANIGIVTSDAPLGDVEGQDLLHEQACYKVKCPRDALGASVYSHKDLFSQHTMHLKSKPFVVCLQGEDVVNVPPAP